MFACHVTVSDALDSDHLPVMFHILDHVSAGDIFAHVEIHTDWELFRSLASDLISPTIKIHTADDSEGAAGNFAASVASAYRLSTRKVTLSDLNNELPELYRLLL
jgi:Mg/Co/Ni transporter MgtE